MAHDPIILNLDTPGIHDTWSVIITIKNMGLGAGQSYSHRALVSFFFFAYVYAVLDALSFPVQDYPSTSGTVRNNMRLSLVV